MMLDCSNRANNTLPKANVMNTFGSYLRRQNAHAAAKAERATMLPWSAKKSKGKIEMYSKAADNTAV